MERQNCGVIPAVWSLCDSWQAFAHPRDCVIANNKDLLLNSLQESLLNAPGTQSCRALLWAGWIRMEFKRRDEEWGQLRVYILPDDVGRRMIERGDSALRKALQLVLSQLDIARPTWDGTWSDENSIAHVDSSLDTAAGDSEDESLFNLFNSLPSPLPDPTIVTDLDAQQSMRNILEGKVEGLTTKMLPYQRRSAAQMIQRESQPAQVVDPRLRRIKDANGIEWYCDIVAGTCLREPRIFESARGGICAETMGLGY